MQSTGSWVTRFLVSVSLSCFGACGGKEVDKSEKPGTSAWWEKNAAARLDEVDPEDVMAACETLEEDLGYGDAFCEFGAVLVAAASSTDDDAFHMACAEHEQTCIDEQIFDVSLCFDTTTLSPDCEAVVADFRDCLTQNTQALKAYGSCESSLSELDSVTPELLPACERLLLCQE